MKNGIFALKNMLTGRIEEIYAMATEGLALRILGNLVDKRGREGNPTENFEDKKLYKLGEYDIESGKIEAEDVPKYIPWGIKEPIETKAEEVKE